MSGKPYSIQEFKMIVDYLVENKLYGETKARKMWVDFANTKLTTRTWQSLKETFLKRVLPDIHNPYFHLTNEQISSFRARCDLADRNKNKLDIITISENSSSNGAKDNEPSHNEGETTAGENITCSKVPVRSRSSADTVILENCYETAEEIQKDLESNESDEKPSRESKSLRDCITYSEPLTPMLQEVLDDFASEPEDSDREGQMEIDENVPEDNQEVPGPNNEVLISKSENTDVAKNAKGLSSEVVSEVVEEVLAQELDGGSKSENISPKENIPNVMSDIEELPVANMDDEISSMQVENGTEKDDDAEASRHAEAPEVTNILTAEVTEKLVAQNPETLDETVIHDSHSEPQVQSGGLNNSNSTVDASLPNNPEALTNKNSKTVNNKEASESVIEVTNNSNKTPKSPKKAPRKRSISEDNSSTIDNKKKKIDINLKPPAKTDNKVTESHSDKNAEDKLKANEEPLQPDVINKPLLDNPIDLEKPSTSFETHVVDVIETEKRSNTKELPEIKNPCLQNISLFDEQFNKTNYTLSESSDTEQNKKESQADKQGTSVSKPSNEVVLVRSNSESDTEEVHAVPKKKQRAGVLISKAEREKAIANMFGFTSGGGVGAKRKRQLSRRSRTVSHNNTSYNNTSHHTAAPAPVSNTSDWTSESEDFVSPPRSRKNRPTRKYMKPHAVKVSALEEEGGLFIMYGKKIYPIIKDGKIVKNYITYLPESDSDEGETFWKQKYEEEKKKASEFKKLLEEAKEPQQLKDTYSPVRQANPHRNSRRSSIAVEPSNSVAKETSLPVPDEKKEELKEFPPETIKIKFTKNNEEVQLEGHWPQIHPVLEQVVNIFHKEVKKAVVPESNTTVMHPAQSQSKLSSGSSTPVIIPDPEIHAKVNEIEKEIFKQIEELDKEEDIKPNGQATNVTKRKMGPPPPRTSSSSAHSPEEPPKISNGPETKESEGNSRTRNKKSKETENNNNTQEYVSKRPTRMPRKILNETVNINQSKTMKTRQSTQKLNTSVNDEDGEVRYMLPPRNSRHSLKSPANKKTNQKKR